MPYKHPTELFLALHHSPGPALTAVPRSLKIRINSIEREWSALLNEMIRVTAVARNAVEKLTLDDTCQLVIEEVVAEELKQSKSRANYRTVY